MSQEQARSDLWMLSGFFLGIAGGVLAYLAVRGDDPALARRCLYVGMAFTAAWLAVLGASGALEADRAEHDWPAPLGAVHLDGYGGAHQDGYLGGPGIGIAVDGPWHEEPDSFGNEDPDEPRGPPGDGEPPGAP